MEGEIKTMIFALVIIPFAAIFIGICIIFAVINGGQWWVGLIVSIIGLIIFVIVSTLLEYLRYKLNHRKEG